MHQNNLILFIYLFTRILCSSVQLIFVTDLKALGMNEGSETKEREDEIQVEALQHFRVKSQQKITLTQLSMKTLPMLVRHFFPPKPLNFVAEAVRVVQHRPVPAPASQHRPELRHGRGE